MVSFDEKELIRCGEYIYNQHKVIEDIADSVCKKGFKNI